MRQRRRRLALLLALLAAAGACGAAPQPKPRQPRLHPPVASIEASFWDDTPFDEPDLPAVAFDREKLVHAQLNERFEALPEAARDRLLARGVVAAEGAHTRSLGEIYVGLAKKKVPFVITLDVLFSIAFRAIERALDELDRDVVAAALPPILAATDERLAAAAHAARSDTERPYAIAMGIVEVARKLLDPNVELPRGTAPDVGMELNRILMHVGPAKSAMFGRTLDYAAFDSQAALAPDDARLPQFRATTWLARAPLALGPEPAQGIDVAMARTQTRAAMLVSRATAFDAWTRLVATKSFATGRGDDPGARELNATATALGLDLRDESTIANVVRVDKLRTTLLHGVSSVEDTGGTLATFRLLSPSAPSDARALAHVVAPNALPQALAVGVALGSGEARALMDEERERGEHAVRTDDIAMTLAGTGPERHASLYASGLDAIATYIASSSYDTQRPWRDTVAHKRRKLEVALAAWATLRHMAMPFARASAQAVIDEPETAYDDVPASIEPHPETIARLSSLVRQAKRGLVASGLREQGASAQLLDRAQTFLEDALRIATAQSTTALAPPLAHALATMPSRLAALERRLGPAAAPLVVVTAADLATGRVLEDGTAHARDVWLVVDVAGAPAAYVGARVPFIEKISTLRSTDATWAKVLEEAPPPRTAWIEPFSAP